MGGQRLVTPHELCDAVAFGDGDGEAVGAEDGAVVRAMGFAQVFRHEDVVVEVGEAAADRFNRRVSRARTG